MRWPTTVLAAVRRRPLTLLTAVVVAPKFAPIRCHNIDPTAFKRGVRAAVRSNSRERLSRRACPAYSPTGFVASL